MRICLTKQVPSHRRFSVSVALFVNILRVIDTVIRIKSGLNSNIFVLSTVLFLFAVRPGGDFVRKTLPRSPLKVN